MLHRRSRRSDAGDCSAADDGDTGNLVGISAGRLDVGRSARIKERRRRPNDAFSTAARWVGGVVDAVLLLLDLTSIAADADDGDAASQLRQSSAASAVVVRGGLLDLHRDLGDAALDLKPFLPAPSTIVVFSFSMRTFLARPSMLSVILKLDAGLPRSPGRR